MKTGTPTGDPLSLILLLVVLAVAMVAALPVWVHSVCGVYGYVPSCVLGVVLLLVLLLALVRGRAPIDASPSRPDFFGKRED